MATFGDLLLVEDFNFHLEDSMDYDAKRFLTLLNSFGLIQHVTTPTHKDGGLLDLVITRSSEKILKEVKVTPPSFSDHGVVHFKLAIEKPPYPQKRIQYRKLKLLDRDKFQSDIMESTLYSAPESSLYALVDQYNSVLSELLEKHAPVKQATITVRPSAPWYTESLDTEKRKRRQLERKYVSTKDEGDKLLFKEQCNRVNSMLLETRQVYYNSEIKKNEKNQKELFRIVDRLLHRRGEPQLPSHDSAAELANRFATFFTEKIEDIRSDLEQKRSTLSASEEAPDCETLLLEFEPASEEEVRQLIMQSATKSCNLDPIPTHLLKDCLTVLLPIITRIVNLSLSSCEVSDNMKHADILPLIKKVLLDCEILKNFRPVSNLCYISKVVERVVAKHLCSHLYINDLHDILQSAYKQYHSTETALVKVQNDILCAIDKKQSVLLVLLDLSAAFDTVDHSLLLQTLSLRMGIRGNALKWIESYLTGRTQSVCIDGHYSDKHVLKCGVPQGSVLGPILFTMYTQAIGDIVRKYEMSYHLYADDTQIYVVFKQSSLEAMSSARINMEQCISEVRSWMTRHLLKLNDDKTEFMLIQSRYTWYPLDAPTLTVGQSQVEPSSEARNIGVIFDSHLSGEKHVNNMTKVAFFLLRDMGRIRQFLTMDSAKTFVHAFVSSKLDYCNALLVGLPNVLTDKLQKALNTAARIVTNTRKYDHITPVLDDLHWLPIKQRVQFKILLLTFKCLHGMAPRYLQDLIKVVNTSTRADKKTVLYEPKMRLVTYGDRAFVSAAPRLWNRLPVHIRQCSELSTFKSQLKTHLFKQAFP